MKLTHERLLEVLRYNKSTGLFTWRANLSRKRKGECAGTITSNGYVRIGIDGMQYGAHRLAVFYVTGRWPACEVDHRNGRKTDNRWRNLRDVSVSTNQHNRTRPNAGRALPLGVTLHKQTGKFQAAMFADKKYRYLGLHDTPEKASRAYRRAKRGLAA